MSLTHLKTSLSPSQQLKELRYQIDCILDKGIAQFLEPWQDTSTPMYIYIQGFTPSFNDGEPCVHTSYAYDANEMITDEVINYHEDLFNGVTYDDLEDSLDWPDSQEFYDAIEAVQECLEFHYETDYHVLITIKDGQVSYVKDIYDCGY